jgi:hypothetical protein
MTPNPDKQRVVDGSENQRKPKGATNVKRILFTTVLLVICAASAFAQQSQYLGRLSANPYSSDSASNPYGQYGSPYSSTSVNNPYGIYGSPYSSLSANNPYTSNAPRLYASDGTYLGKLSANVYDSESVSNPYGRYGSSYSSTSINNPYSVYGSPYSSISPTNPYSNQGPVIIGGYRFKH